MHALAGGLIGRRLGRAGRRAGRRWLAAWALVALGCAAGAGEDGTAATAAPEAAQPRRLTVRVEAVFPHDPAAWTQGLLWHGGRLYESVGLYGASALRRVDPVSGEVEREARLAADLFAEGLALADGILYQLTWRAGRGLRWDVESLEPRGEFGYPGEGWGLCALAGELVRSDGSHRLHFHRPGGGFELVRSLEVERAGRPQERLNELECVDGWIYANVWTTDEIVRIDPASGRVEAVIDASGLLTAEERAAAEVLNGIAYVPERRTFLLTGKNWPKLFEVQLVPLAVEVS